MANNIKFFLSKHGVMLEGIFGVDFAFLLKRTPKIGDYPSNGLPDKFELKRMVIDFEVWDTESQPLDKDLKLTIFIKDEDLNQGKNINDIGIFKFDSRWKELTILNSYMGIPSNLREIYGSEFVGYCEITYNPKNDPPIAVG